MRVKAAVGRQRLIRWVNHWRRFCARRIRLRVEKETFPACSSRLPLGQQVASLKSKGETTVLQLKRKSIIDQNVSAKRLNYLSGNLKYLICKRTPVLPLLLCYN